MAVLVSTVETAKCARGEAILHLADNRSVAYRHTRHKLRANNPNSPCHNNGRQGYIEIHAVPCHCE
ncbi:hypothetical protein J6590_061875 [Homalodisca vitripennis]|nr:hypothetical protein J6590_061875 [Homalodisca vitripennis]